LDVLLSSYFVGGGKHPEYEGRKVYFDLSKIRPKGSKISGGFKAPGPDPLRKALDHVEFLLQGLILKGQKKLKSINAYDIIMHCSDAVLSGGVRRAATICIFSIDDEEMMKAKTGNWFVDNPQRGRSNNSALVLRNGTTKEQFSNLFQHTKEYGEPGFIFADTYEALFNPCVEIGMYGHYEDDTGFQGCNLVEINGFVCDTPEKFYQICEEASIMGTIQAGYTDFKFVSETTRKIFEREALLGVSITGWMNSPNILFDKEVLENGAKIVKETNKKVAKLLGINTAARTTCTKPAGTTSVLLGTASGIHPEHSPKYIRNMQMNKDQEVGQLIKKQNPYMIEDSVWNSRDFVISFPVTSSNDSHFKKDMLDTKFLEKVKFAQEHWVESGTNKDLCVEPGIRHNISNTVVVPEHRWDKVKDYLFENKEFFAGVSFISESGDKDYPQAPFTQVFTEKQIIEMYGEASLFASGLIVDGLSVFNTLWEACSSAQNDSDENSQEKLDSQADWIRRFYKFADTYFDGNLKTTEYCLKDVYLLHKWCKIRDNYKSVSFTNDIKEIKYTDIDTISAEACHGGACEL
jgi:ribonucleoside-diphosphate reductase alpha chain